jgi:hypothetical protein
VDYLQQRIAVANRPSTSQKTDVKHRAGSVGAQGFRGVLALRLHCFGLLYKIFFSFSLLKKKKQRKTRKSGVYINLF